MNRDDNGNTAVAETVERLTPDQQSIQELELECNNLADEVAVLKQENATLKVNGGIQLEPATRAILDSFIDDSNKRRGKAGKRLIKDACFWASEMVSKGIVATRNAWKSSDTYVATKVFNDELKTAVRTGNTERVAELLELLKSAS